MWLSGFRYWRPSGRMKVVGVALLCTFIGLAAVRLGIDLDSSYHLCPDVPCRHFLKRVRAIERDIGLQRGSKVYLAIGDSLTEFAPLPPICGRRPINAGIAWATSRTFQTLARRLSALSNPDFIVLAIGTNDALRATTEFRANMAKLVASLDGYPIVLIPIPGGPGVARASKYNEALVGLAPMARRADQIKYDRDGIHLVPSAYPTWISSIDEAVEKYICGRLSAAASDFANDIDLRRHTIQR
jgi:hypothetical protein